MNCPNVREIQRDSIDHHSHRKKVWQFSEFWWLPCQTSTNNLTAWHPFEITRSVVVYLDNRRLSERLNIVICGVFRWTSRMKGQTNQLKILFSRTTWTRPWSTWTRPTPTPPPPPWVWARLAAPAGVRLPPLPTWCRTPNPSTWTPNCS